MSGAAEKPEVRWIQRFHSFRQAFAQLISAVELAKQRELSELEKQGMIQAFEFTHELAWNTLKDYLQDRGETAFHGSKDATRRAFKVELITNGDIWMEMIESRNSSTHTYNQRTANLVVSLIVGAYFAAFQEFENRFLELEGAAE